MSGAILLRHAHVFIAWKRRIWPVLPAPTVFNLPVSQAVLRSSQFYENNLPWCGPGSSVGVGTGYGLDVSEIKSRWGQDFAHLSRPALGPIQPPVNGYRVFPGGQERPGRDADPSLPLMPWLWKSRAIPLLPLWAVWPVQSLSACTRVTFTFNLPS